MGGAMKKYFYEMMTGLCVMCGAAAAEHTQFGLGIILGVPTGIDGKYWLTNDRAIEGAVAWNFNDSYFSVQADYLWHFFQAISVETGQLPLDVGIGAYLAAGHHWAGVGIRIPLGISYIFSGAPLDIFFHIAPTLRLVPDTDFGLGGGIGIRYYFK
jgi:hypothetical protein